MTIFDRYILRSFLKTYCLWFFCLIGLFVVFDLFTKTDGFIRAGGNATGTLTLIARYYLVQSLPFFAPVEAGPRRAHVTEPRRAADHWPL